MSLLESEEKLAERLNALDHQAATWWSGVLVTVLPHIHQTVGAAAPPA
jgi:hypothetical protein